MPSKKRLIRLPDHPIPADRLQHIRMLAARAAAKRQADTEAAITEANLTLGKFERGYFLAWRDFILAARA